MYSLPYCPKKPYLYDVERDILHLYQQAQIGPLEAKEVHWLENQVNEYPYFALPRIILARHQFQRDTNIQSRQLLEGAAYSLDRGHFRNYLYMSLPAAPEVVGDKKDTVKEAMVSTEPTPAGVAQDEVKATSAETELASKSAVEKSVGVQRDSTSDDSVFPENEKVGKINWFLNTTIQIKTSKYLGQYGKIKAGLFSHDSFAEVQAKAPVESPKTSSVKSPETSSVESPNAETPESAKTKEEKAKAVEALLASRRGKKSRSGQDREDQEKAEGYEIGAFSSFSFVDDGDAGEEDNGEINTLVQAGEIVSLQSPENSSNGYSELVIESDDRRLEVLITPEELETYFNGKLPAIPARRAHGLSATNDEPVHLQFDFLVSEEELEDEEDRLVSENSPRTEVQNLNAKSSPELISATSVVEAKRDEEKERQLIHKFIEHEPSITRGGHVHAPAGDLAKESLKDEDDWVTETLAKVFVMQGNNARAIRIYKKLALLFPEKRAYFDVQISKLKR